MGRNYHFRPGSFYRVDDRTGFPQRAERTRKQWNNLIVDEKVWEPRQPQDLVRGVQDDQTVYDARPLSPDQFVGPVWTTTTQPVAIGSRTIAITSLSSFSVGDLVAIMLDADGGVLFRAYVTAVGMYSFGTNLTTESGFSLLTEGGFVLMTDNLIPGISINVPVPSPISIGAQVWNYGPIAGGPATKVSSIPILFNIVPAPPGH